MKKPLATILGLITVLIFILVVIVATRVEKHDLAVLFTLALSDAINPCATYIYVLLLTASALSAARTGRKILLASTGLAFILTVYTGYYMLGIGLIILLSHIPVWMLPVIAIVFGIWIIASGLLEKSRVVAKASILNLIRKAKASILFSALLGFTVTFTLLPCSSGPYVTFAGLASKYPLPIAYVLLALYNMVFVSPLILILVLIYYSMNYRAVQETIIKYNRLSSIIAGILLILIGAYMLLDFLKGV